MNKVRLFVIFLAVCPAILPQHAFAAKSRKDVPLAPVPSKILTAKKVFVANGGGNDLAFDALYASIKDWPRYEIVDTSSGADIIMEIRYVTEDQGVRVWSTTNSATGATNVHSTHVVDPQLVLTIFDPISKEQLWSTVEHRQMERRSHSVCLESLCRRHPRQSQTL